MQVTKDPDQDSTDFGKCMKFVATRDPPASYVAGPGEKGVRIEHPPMAVVAQGGFGGRVDQSFHSVCGGGGERTRCD